MHVLEEKKEVKGKPAGREMCHSGIRDEGRPGARQVPRGDQDPLRNFPLVPAKIFSWQADNPGAHI